MAKFKIGDVVKPSARDDGYLHENLISSNTYTVNGYNALWLTVSGDFRGGDTGEGWSEDWFELVHSTNQAVDAGSAESLRIIVLDIRTKREALQKELLQLDEQEKEVIEKLKERGFILYEDNVSKEALVATNKAVLYAEDIEDDMTNPRNWKVGDLVESISEIVPMPLPFGSIQEVLEVTKSALRITDASGSSVSTFDSAPKYFKFHSRLVK